MTQWYWKDGTPVMHHKTKLGSKTWLKNVIAVEKKLRDPNYSRIGDTRLWWGGRVSTVWLAIDYSFSLKEKPLIFESMVFGWLIHKGIGQWYGHDLDMNRYSTEGEAKSGHAVMVKNWNNPLWIIKNYLRKR